VPDRGEGNDRYQRRAQRDGFAAYRELPAGEDDVAVERILAAESGSVVKTHRAEWATRGGTAPNTVIPLFTTRNRGKFIWEIL